MLTISSTECRLIYTNMVVSTICPVQLKLGMGAYIM